MNIDVVIDSFVSLKKYCERNEFTGSDPYDGLNSRFFNKVPFFSDYKLVKLTWIQFHKKSPINLRNIFQIPKALNPKALGIFLTAYCKIYKKYNRDADLLIINKLINDIYRLQRPGYSGACWGYHFDWQSTAFFQPKNTPTVVVSSFIGLSLLDAFEIIGDEKLLNTAKSTADFILNDLNREFDSEGNFALSYSPLDKTIVFNASLLGANLLSRLYYYSGNLTYKNAAKNLIQYCCNKQHPDGSWYYGTSDTHRWIDSFHTGYNIESLYTYQMCCNDNSFNSNIELGLAYYLNTFFTTEGYSKYYHNKIYPIDIHSISQLIITLSKLKIIHHHKNLVNKVLQWTIKNMQAKEGYYYFQKHRCYTNKVSYMRWSQSWMLYALISYIEAVDKKRNKPVIHYEKLFKTNQFFANSN